MLASPYGYKKEACDQLNSSSILSYELKTGAAQKGALNLTAI